MECGEGEQKNLFNFICFRSMVLFACKLYVDLVIGERRLESNIRGKLNANVRQRIADFGCFFVEGKGNRC